MADEKDGQLHEDYQVLDETSDPPPAYSPPACSIASSEASLWTVEPDIAPDFTNTSQQESSCATVGVTASMENIEPFVAVGKRLPGDSHRVRIAAHASCEPLVTDQGLDFFAISLDMIHPTARLCTYTILWNTV
ncbi:hypothetical protein BDV33DRAFT_197441 [Aspergillus novoparasiticus]|uniref:Uncharacterized protein n=1 Tax=Aspergillus novoparasiticus TaxID=986946 RepID=A0A5N6F977_9EURO|nr:hypothetical protein BDV33DRAFT_197441 [Aspergillus novoparasiticus]